MPRLVCTLPAASFHTRPGVPDRPKRSISSKFASSCGVEAPSTPDGNTSNSRRRKRRERAWARSSLRRRRRFFRRWRRGREGRALRVFSCPLRRLRMPLGQRRRSQSWKRASHRGAKSLGRGSISSDDRASAQVRSTARPSIGTLSMRSYSLRLRFRSRFISGKANILSNIIR